jgi:signal peptidase I
VTTATAPEVDETDAARPADNAGSTRRMLWFAAALVGLVLLHALVVEPVRVRSDSMAPTLPSGALLLIDKLTYHGREPRRGEVIVTTDPGTGGSIVKRIVAIGGDSVGIEDGQLIVNGTPVDEDYIQNTDMEGFFFGPDVVPTGHVFLLGDNRSDSVDSRAFGPVAVDDIEGRVLVRLWG